MMMRRRGPGLVRVAATTAVMAGTAGAVRHHQQQKYEGQQMAQQADAQAAYDAGVAAAQAQAPAPAAPAAGGDDTMAKIQQLADLHASGILTDEEFAAAKAKLLA
jgi:hypothetical protein